MLVGLIAAITFGLLYFLKGLIVEKWKNLDDILKKKIRIITPIVVLIFLIIFTIVNPAFIVFAIALVVLYLFYLVSERILKD